MSSAMSPRVNVGDGERYAMSNADRKATSVAAIFFEENGGITGFVEEFLEVTAHGRNLKEARTRLIDAIRDKLEDDADSVRQRAASYGTVTLECLFVEFRRKVRGRDA